MASGKLGASDLAATTNTTVYTVPASTLSVVNISVCNRNAAVVAFRLAIAESATPGVEDYIEYDTSLGANSSFERTGIVIDATKLVVAYSDTANVSVVVWGYEEVV